MIIVLLKSAFLFFVLTSGRPLPVTTFFVFSKPLCSADHDSGIFGTAVCFVRGDRAFFAAVPTMWNALPDELRALGSFKTFMERLKTHYFKLAFSL